MTVRRGRVLARVGPDVRAECEPEAALASAGADAAAALGTDVADARAGETLEVLPPDLSDPEVGAILRRSDRLHRPEIFLPADAPVLGDHILDPNIWPVPLTDARHAAVLIALSSDSEGQLCVILTERSVTLRAHAGQIALPGGRIEPGETPVEAALREADEEVGLPAGAVRPLGFADPYATRTGFLVVPVLGLLTRQVTLRPDPREVAAVFVAPWDRLINAHYRREIAVERDGVTRRFYETMWEERRIWGVTAGILKLVEERLAAS